MGALDATSSRKARPTTRGSTATRRKPVGRQRLKIGRRAYAEMFGPTVGDRVRLADTRS
jgi:hypothetical protein